MATALAHAARHPKHEQRCRNTREMLILSAKPFIIMCHPQIDTPQMTSQICHVKNMNE